MKTWLNVTKGSNIRTEGRSRPFTPPARRLDRSRRKSASPPRTIYAELKRGREGDKLDKNFRPSYDADLAQKRAQESLRRCGRRKGGPAE